MVEKSCNLWLEPAEWRCIPTIGATAPDGAAIMDAGLAREAASRYANLEGDLGVLLTSRGNHVHELRPGLLSFPYKQYIWSGLNLPILERSARELMTIVGAARTLLPRPPMGPSDPPWEQVAQTLSFLPDNIVVIQHTP